MCFSYSFSSVSFGRIRASTVVIIERVCCILLYIILLIAGLGELEETTYSQALQYIRQDRAKELDYKMQLVPKTILSFVFQLDCWKI